MTYQYLLDTGILSHLVKQPRGPIFHGIREFGEKDICTSVVVACELRAGAMKRGSQQLIEQLEIILRSLPVLPLPDSVDQAYAEIRTALEGAGTTIGSNDLLIAAHALTLDLTLVTTHVYEFSRVPHLKVEGWLCPNENSIASSSLCIFRVTR
ncbi:MAG: type II toxin-antitoxin system VapC family toxin [Symploca sp. SIO2B6]|nr:type II toxin-antitoxin system VapC family toxin [Symploca sp. SIO2B6]